MFFIPIDISYQEVREPAGHAAMFCPVCRDLRTAEAVRLGEDLRAFQVIKLSQSKRKLVLRCLMCGCPYRAADDYPTCPEAPPESDPVDLLAEADESVLAALRTRLDLEERRERGRLTPAERQALLVEPLRELEYLGAQSPEGRLYIPTVTGLAIIALVFLLPLTVLVWMYTRDWQPKAVLALLDMLAIGAILYDQHRGEPKRRASGVHAMLARALLPLKPTDYELSQALVDARTQRLRLWRRISLPRLRAELKRLAAEGEAGATTEVQQRAVSPARRI